MNYSMLPEVFDYLEEREMWLLSMTMNNFSGPIAVPKKQKYKPHLGEI